MTLAVMTSGDVLTIDGVRLTPTFAAPRQIRSTAFLSAPMRYVFRLCATAPTSMRFGSCSKTHSIYGIPSAVL
jgi:hypothetical protein